MADPQRYERSEVPFVARCGPSSPYEVRAERSRRTNQGPTSGSKVRITAHLDPLAPKPQPPPSPLAGVDVFTHVLLGYAAGIIAHGALKDRAKASQSTYGLVAAAAAFAPDLDVFIAPLSQFPDLYWLQHRGVSHSIIGAPIAALLFVLLLGVLSRRWKSLASAQWSPGIIPPLLLGAWSHLLLDGVTHHGIPLLWPLTPDAFSLEWFHWIVWWLAPPSAGILWLKWRGHWDAQSTLRASAVIVAVLVVLGGVRVFSAPDGDTYATGDPLEWIVVEPHPDGARVDLVRGNTILDSAWYWHTVPPDAMAAESAIRDSVHFASFRMSSIGPFVWQAESTTDGDWNVTVIDVVQRFEARSAPFSRDFAEETSQLRATVSQDGRRVTILS